MTLAIGAPFVRDASRIFAPTIRVVGRLLLRDYQTTLVEEIVSSDDRLLVAAPTGSGKTVVASEVIRRMEAPTLFVAHRRELILQARDHLSEFGIDAGTILGGEEHDLGRRVQLASVQSLTAWRRRGRPLPQVDLIVIDEAHHMPADSYRALVEMFPGAKLVGFTATPCRRDGRALSDDFDRLIEAPQVAALVSRGHLVPAKVFAPAAPSLKGVHTRHGDFVEAELAERLDRPELVGDIVAHWRRLADGRKTVAFAVTVAHATSIRDEFLKAGIRAAMVDGSTPKLERDEVLERLAAGDLDVVSNCLVLTEGWDSPSVSCCIMARPTKSLGLYRQMAGRVLRPAPGKADALILDHAGNVFRHGLIEDEIRWTLDAEEVADNLSQRGRKVGVRKCSQCHAVKTKPGPCQHCGAGAPLEVACVGGELRPVTSGDVVARDLEDRMGAYAQLLWLADEFGYQRGWADHTYRKRFGVWPFKKFSVTPRRATPEVRAWAAGGAGVPDDITERLKFCMRHLEQATEWERGFLHSVSHQYEQRAQVTPKQAAVIGRIYERQRTAA